MRVLQSSCVWTMISDVREGVTRTVCDLVGSSPALLEIEKVRGVCFAHSMCALLLVLACPMHPARIGSGYRNRAARCTVVWWLVFHSTPTSLWCGNASMIVTIRNLPPVLLSRRQVHSLGEHRASHDRKGHFSAISCSYVVLLQLRGRLHGCFQSTARQVPLLALVACSRPSRVRIWREPFDLCGESPSSSS
jgi:hypothetical protein